MSAMDERIRPRVVDQRMDDDRDGLFRLPGGTGFLVNACAQCERAKMQLETNKARFPEIRWVVHSLTAGFGHWCKSSASLRSG
jgi:hypothetical protein